ncbi:expansin-A9-like [Neltuma alba]|uniref:expansin-A9-like n=1 Tax=Neltuma alba TaxID=207710 RepID=UPI0010A580DC|nr:expansin-A9-like [Prosopis alba]
MALPLRTLLASFMLFLIIIALWLPHVHADANPSQHVGGGTRIALSQPRFVPSPWRQAHATFYEGGSGTYGGACGYEDVEKEGYGLQTAALSQVLYKDGLTCGACYEIRCVNSPWCKHIKPSIFVTATDYCPPNFNLASDNGGWCNPPGEHFDLAKPAYLDIAEYQGGIVPINYRRVACKRQGGIRFSITGNPYFYLVSLSNVGGAGDVVGVKVKGSKKVKWTVMSRNWGQKWQTNAMLLGESLSFRVRTSDGRCSTSWHVTPENWQFGMTYQGKNFK